jgi:glycosyltransferase involved in cell wall biosynthesis
MATGLPCVLSDIPVFRELYSETAVLVPPGRSDLFAQAILGLLADPVKYDELAGRGTRLMAGLTWDVVAKRMKWVVLNT